MAPQQLNPLVEEDALDTLYGDTRALLRRLDGLELHQAAAYVSMALEVMRQLRPGLPVLD